MRREPNHGGRRLLCPKGHGLKEGSFCPECGAELSRDSPADVSDARATESEIRTEGLITAPDHAAQPEPRSTMLPLTSGQTICDGKYEILGLKGEGTFARVWTAQEYDTEGKPLRLVALKELKRESLTSDALAEQTARFQREVRVAAQILDEKVPNIVMAITTERLVTQQRTIVPLLVMEHMAGGSLETKICDNPTGLPIEEAIRITCDLSAGLAGLHRLGIVHRDIKPSNILFHFKDDVARLADLGTVQLPGETLRGSRTLGTAGPHPGSQDYMPDEQLYEQGYLQPTSDIYALGCVLFEMLTAQRWKRFEKQQPRVKVSDLRRDVPDQVDWVMERALAHQPSDRWQSVQDFARELASFSERAEDHHQDLPTSIESMRAPEETPSGNSLYPAPSDGSAVWRSFGPIRIPGEHGTRGGPPGLFSTVLLLLAAAGIVVLALYLVSGGR